jgi:anaerobic ribonucleoside-triphosphate reductase
MEIITLNNKQQEKKMKQFKMPKIYANQWTSLWDNAGIYQKMKRDGEINSLMTGGSIVHISVDSKLTSTQAKKLIGDAIKEGMEHFALNCYYTACDECKKVEKGNFHKCPHCGGHKLRHYSRIIGYFVQVENANKARRELDFPNRKFVTAEMLKQELGN